MHHRRLPPTTGTSPVTDTGRLTIMIVEDDAIIALDLRQQLESSGFRVSGVVGRSDEVVATVQSQRPDAVIMDIRLDGSVDGVSLAEEIFVCEDTPVVFLSAYADEALGNRAVHSGAYGYLTKPVAIQAVLATVGMAVQKHRDLRRRRTMADHLCAAVNTFEESIVVLDADGCVAFMNRPAMQLTGCALARAHKTQPPWVAALSDAWERAGRNGVFTATLRRAHGAAVEISGRGMHLETGGVSYRIW